MTKQILLALSPIVFLVVLGLAHPQDTRCQQNDCQEPIVATASGATELLAEVAACNLATWYCNTVGGMPGNTCYIIQTVYQDGQWRSTAKKCCYKCGPPLAAK
jgi:hypothetical protein